MISSTMQTFSSATFGKTDSTSMMVESENLLVLQVVILDIARIRTA